MNISGPVRVEPTRPMTISKRGTDSPRNTANATMADLMRHRWTQKSANNYSNVIEGIVRKMHLPKLPNLASARDFDLSLSQPIMRAMQCFRIIENYPTLWCFQDLNYLLINIINTCKFLLIRRL